MSDFNWEPDEGDGTLHMDIRHRPDQIIGYVPKSLTPSLLLSFVLHHNTVKILAQPLSGVQYNKVTFFFIYITIQ